ncbi:MAG: sugar phosphate nucleotidyltransferase [Promethearchaeota archaeon]
MSQIKMKKIILAIGWGTRLDYQTKLIPKPMVKISSKTILKHIMKMFFNHSYNDFINCINRR